MFRCVSVTINRINKYIFENPSDNDFCSLAFQQQLWNLTSDFYHLKYIYYSISIFSEF